MILHHAEMIIGTIIFTYKNKFSHTFPQKKYF